MLIITAILIVGIVWLISVFYRFVKNKNTVQNAWNNLEVILKKRYELIPNLVNIAKSHIQYEQPILNQVITTRNTAMGISKKNISAQISAEHQLNESLNHLFSIIEAYPKLKTDTSFLNLQKDLLEAEKLLEQDRKFYNSAVLKNNRYGETMPGEAFASIFNYHHFDFFDEENS